MVLCLSPSTPCAESHLGRVTNTHYVIVLANDYLGACFFLARTNRSFKHLTKKKEETWRKDKDSNEQRKTETRKRYL